MNRFDKEFICELFLDTDSVNTLNRLVVAAANIVNENNENMTIFNEAIREECCDVLPDLTKEPVNKITIERRGSYYEENVLQLSDEEYFDKFKMKRTTVQELIKLLSQHVKSDSSGVLLDKKVHLFIFLMVSDLSYNAAGSLFGLYKSSVSQIFYEVASLLTKYKSYFINWPAIEDQHLTRLKVNSRFQFPNCVGFIDVCRFKICPKRSRRYEPEIVLLQAVCDESLMFTDIHVGSVGKVKKSKVFKESPLSQELKKLVDFDNHILGDSDYKLKKNLMTPFTSEEVLTSEEMKFNEVHWRARSYIGHAFELLKENFRKLSHLDGTKSEAIESVICAACVLHNFRLLHEGSSEIKEEAVICDVGVTIDTSIVKTAIEKRQFICNYINYINIGFGSELIDN